MTYAVKLTQQAEKSFSLLMKSQPAFAARIARAIDRISENPELGTPLRGSLKGLQKYRVGPYRIIYEIRRSSLIITVIDIGHRKEIYR